MIDTNYLRKLTEIDDHEYYTPGKQYLDALNDSAEEIDRLVSDREDWRKGVALVYRALGEPDPPGLCCATLTEKVLALRAENERMRKLLADSALYVGRMVNIFEGYNHPSRITVRAKRFYERELRQFARTIHANGAGE